MWLETKVPPLVVLAIAIALTWILHRISPGGATDTAAVKAIASVLAVGGVLLAIAGVMAFRKADTTLDPVNPDRASNLVVSGIYRYTRNPMYLGMLLLSVAGSFVFPSYVAVLGPVFFVGYMNRFQIGPEERAMRKSFGSEYARYVSQTNRWLGTGMNS